MAKKNTAAAVTTSADARKALAERVEAFDQAEAHAEALRNRLDEGDTTVTAADLTAADAAVEVASRLLAAARKALATAEQAEARKAANASPEIAEVVARFMESSKHRLGYLALPLQVVPTLPTEAKGDGPMFYLCQTKPTEHNDRSGLISGECVLAVVSREPFERNPMREAVRDAAMAENVRIEFASHPGSRQLPDGSRLQCQSVTVKHALAKTPVINYLPQPHDVNSFAMGVAADVMRAGGGRPAGVRAGSGGSAEAIKYDIDAWADDVQLSSSREADTVRLTLTLALGMTSRDVDGDTLNLRARQVVDAYAGAFVASFGHVETAEITRIAPRPGGREAWVRFVFTHKTTV